MVKKEETIINNKKIEKEIIKNVNKKIEEQLDNKIEILAKEKLNVMEKRFIKYKNNKIRKRNIIIILLLLVIALETKIIYDNNYKLGYKKETIIKKEKINKEEHDLDWYKKNYGYLLDNINTNFEDTAYLYKEVENENSLDNKTKLNIAYQNIKNKSSNNGIISIENSKLKEEYNKMFNDKDYKEENFDNNCINFIYNKKTNNYMAIEIECDNEKEIKKEIINVYEENDNIIIEAIVAIKDENKLENIYEETIEENYKNESLSNYKENLNTYKYTFIKDNNSYKLDKIEKFNI